MMTRSRPQAPVSVSRQLNAAAGRVNALSDKWLGPHDLTMPQWTVLACLWRHGKLPVGVLAELVGARTSSLSRLIDEMASRGLVVCGTDDEDGKVSVVDLAERGARLRHLSNLHETLNAVLFEGFSEQEQRQFSRLLRRVRANAQAVLKSETRPGIRH